MAGGLIDLVTKGIEDQYLTDNPQITFFKIVYRRHTNFAIESVPLYFQGKTNFGETTTCTISKTADLLGETFLYVEIPAIPRFINADGTEDQFKKFAWVENLGYALIKEIYIEIDNVMIDKQYGEWLYIWSLLSKTQPKAIDKMVGNVPVLTEFTNGKPGYQLYIPLEFWFCRATGLSLPIVALGSSAVKITVTFRKAEECYRLGPTNSIEIMEDISPFNPGDYIRQTIGEQTVSGYVTGFDYINRKLFYIKILNGTGSSIKTQITSAKIEPILNPTLDFGTRSDSLINNSIYRQDNVDNELQQTTLAQINTRNNIQQRIYLVSDNSNVAYVTPRPGAVENVESQILPFQINFTNAYLLANYIYLDIEERRRFLTNTNEYLIEQLQLKEDLNVTSINFNQNINFNHPCKEFFWVVQLVNLIGPGTINDRFNYTASYLPNAPSLMLAATMVLDGRNRFSLRSNEYFNLIEPYEHHSRGPKTGINVYSPSLNPEQIQPSSTLNMSKFNNATLNMQLSSMVNINRPVNIRTYALNYNVLRIAYNMAGLVFV